MKAVLFPEPGPIDAPDALVDVEIDAPAPKGRDVLVRVNAVAVNPVDCKVRRGMYEIATGGTNILGWDAAGVVEAVGPEVSLFKPGDEVYYAGAIERSGSYAELSLVDERIVARKPKTLSFAEAAALPLTTLTAWEMLFDRLEIPRAGGQGDGDAILIVGAGGGVGSIAVQLARRLTTLTVIGTASRPETTAWVADLGAHHVIDHTNPLAQELERRGLARPRYVFVVNGAEALFAQVAEAVAPQGKLGFINAFESFDPWAFFTKSVSAHWEFMFTRHLHHTPDIEAQHRLLSEAAALIDEGRLRTTLGEHLGRINAQNLVKAHKLLESGRAKGKIVLEGF